MATTQFVSTSTSDRLDMVSGGSATTRTATTLLGEFLICSINDDQFEIVHPIEVIVSMADDGYIGSFTEANISASGETPLDAVFSLISLLVDIFSFLSENEAD